MAMSAEKRGVQTSLIANGRAAHGKTFGKTGQSPTKLAKSE